MIEMSDAADDRDAQVLEAVGGDADELAVGGGDVDPDREYVTREEFEDLQQTVKRLVRMVNNLQSEELDGLTTLEKYTRMYEAGETDPLSASDERAVQIHRHWGSLAVRLANGHLGVSTRTKSGKKHGPSQLKVDLELLSGEELQSNQIYRAMKRVAELSGGSAEPDQYGRTKIVGGVYEYHVRTSPDNTDHETYRVLIET